MQDELWDTRGWHKPHPWVKDAIRTLHLKSHTPHRTIQNKSTEDKKSDRNPLNPSTHNIPGTVDGLTLTRIRINTAKHAASFEKLETNVDNLRKRVSEWDRQEEEEEEKTRRRPQLSLVNLIRAQTRAIKVAKHREDMLTDAVENHIAETLIESRRKMKERQQLASYHAALVDCPTPDVSFVRYEDIISGRSVSHPHD
jgi:hypothetical protein